MSLESCDVVVIGAGAAGLMCAIEAGRRGRRVQVLERANKPGKKILMSGGGRCNFTNLEIEPERYLSANPAYCRSALARYTQWDFIAKVERHGIAYHEKELGQLFCDESSKQILRMLLDECREAGVQLSTGANIDELRRHGEGYALRIGPRNIECAALVVASGGLSIPKMGASGYGYELARQFGHTVLPTRAGLVPLTLSDRPLDEIDGLAGVSLPVVATCREQAFRAAMLYTHRGLSGPAILQISSYWTPGVALSVNLLPDCDAGAWLLHRKAETPTLRLESALAERLPKRLAQRLSELHGTGVDLHGHSDEALRRIGGVLNDYPIKASGTEGYRTAEVTLGGVDTRELSSKTMASIRMPNLYFIGEVVDVSGWLGGYNFQWAWASGHAAGQVC